MQTIDASEKLVIQSMKDMENKKIGESDSDIDKQGEERVKIQYNSMGKLVNIPSFVVYEDE